MWRTLKRAAVLTSIMTLGIGAGTASIATASTAANRPPALNWRPCADTSTLDCATLSVPVDWAHPRGPSFDLALARLKATDPKHRIGSMLINPGGPGGSGVGFVKRAPQYFSAALRARFDIVSWDPRGVGLSHPVLCDADLVNNPVSSFPKNQAEFNALLAYNKKVGDSCRKDTGPLFDHVDTISTVRDMDAVRAALGEKKITYYGISYGTGVGQEYAERFPTHIRSMALDSNMDHSIQAFRYVATETGAFEGSYRQFAQWCGRTTSCELHPRNAINVLDELYARAGRGALYTPGHPDQTITPEELLDPILNNLYRITNWHAIAQDLLALLNEPPRGTDSAAVRTTGNSGTVANPYQAIWCEDHNWDIHTFGQLAALRRAMERIAPHTHVSTLGWTDVSGCLGWPRPIRDPQHPLRVHGAPTILMTNGIYDVSTPYPWATDAASQLGREAVLLTYGGTGHGDYTPSPCARAAIDAHLINLVTPRRGSFCPAVFPAAVPQSAIAPVPGVLPHGF